MKLINQNQQAKFELLFQVATSAIFATILVSVIAIVTSPYGFLPHAAGL